MKRDPVGPAQSNTEYGHIVVVVVVVVVVIYYFSSQDALANLPSR